MTEPPNGGRQRRRLDHQLQAPSHSQPLGHGGPLRSGSRSRRRSRTGPILTLVAVIVMLGAAAVVIVASNSNSVVAGSPTRAADFDVPPHGAEPSGAQPSTAERAGSAAAEFNASAASQSSAAARSSTAAQSSAAARSSTASQSSAARSNSARSSTAARSSAAAAAQSSVAAHSPATSAATKSPSTANAGGNGEPIYRLADHPLLQDPNAGLPNLVCSLPAWQNTQAGIERFFTAARSCLDASWRPLIENYHLPFRSPELRFPSTTSFKTGCGTQRVGIVAAAYYCDDVLYIPLAGLQTDLYGDSPSVYLSLFAHEYGHHVQQMAGLMSSAWEKIRAAGENSAAGLQWKRRLELQAQ